MTLIKPVLMLLILSIFMVCFIKTTVKESLSLFEMLSGRPSIVDYTDIMAALLLQSFISIVVTGLMYLLVTVVYITISKHDVMDDEIVCIDNFYNNDYIIGITNKNLSTVINAGVFIKNVCPYRLSENISWEVK